MVAYVVDVEENHNLDVLVSTPLSIGKILRLPCNPGDGNQMEVFHTHHPHGQTLCHILAHMLPEDLHVEVFSTYPLPLDVVAWAAFSYSSLSFHEGVKEGALVLGYVHEANQALCPFLHGTQVIPAPTIHEVVEGAVLCHGVVVAPRDLDRHVGSEAPCEEEGHVGHVPYPVVVEDVVDHGA